MAGTYFGAMGGLTNLFQTEEREPANPLAHNAEAAKRLFDGTQAIIAEEVKRQGIASGISGGSS